jgi:hypothetical protein
LKDRGIVGIMDREIEGLMDEINNSVMYKTPKDTVHHEGHEEGIFAWPVFVA